MTDITYYNNTTGQILGNFKNIDLTTYPDIPSYYIEGEYSDDYYMVAGVPTLRTNIPIPDNLFLKSGNVDGFTLTIPNPTIVGLSSTSEQTSSVNSQVYSATITDGSFNVTSSIAGYYKCSIIPDAISYKPLHFEFQVTDNHGVMTTNYNVNFNNPTFKAAVKFDNQQLVFGVNFNTPIVNAGRLITSTTLNHTMTFNLPIVNASRDISVDTNNYSMTFNLPIVNAGYIIENETIDFGMTFNVPAIINTLVIDNNLPIETIDFGWTFEQPIVNARQDIQVNTIDFTNTINIPNITIT